VRDPLLSKDSALTHARDAQSSGLLRIPQPYDFALSTRRFRSFGPDLANLWADGGLHRVVNGRDVRIKAAPGGVSVEPLDAETGPLVRQLLGLTLDLEAFAGWAAGDPVLARIVAHLRGLRPTFWVDPFEALVDCITAQQVSLYAAFAIRSRMTARFGMPAGGGFAFPTPERLAQASEEELMSLGFPRRKAEYVIGLSRSGLDLGSLRRLADAEVKTVICGQRGLGTWTADWFLARYLGRAEAWPAEDLSLRKAVALFYPQVVHGQDLGRRFAPFQNLTAQFLIAALSDPPP
jgi:3-methyladenine DNA glycosylase/8-oxoguanine DNA glycosylase